MSQLFCSILGQDAFQPRDRIPRTPAKTDDGKNSSVVFDFVQFEGQFYCSLLLLLQPGGFVVLKA